MCRHRISPTNGAIYTKRRSTNPYAKFPFTTSGGRKQIACKPCPPVYVGVGIGGTFDTCAFLAKKALTRDIGTANPRADVAQIEQISLQKINALGIGAQGFGGKTTALGVACEVAPTHIAGLPVAVNIQCHCVRCEKAEI